MIGPIKKKKIILYYYFIYFWFILMCLKVTVLDYSRVIVLVIIRKVILIAQESLFFNLEVVFVD